MAELSREQMVAQHVEKNFRWNFSVNLIDVAFIMFGLNLISRETVIPLLISQLTDSKIAIGALPAIFSLGIYLPQLIGANIAETMPYKKPFVAIVGGIGERLPYLMAGILVFLFAETAPNLALPALMICFGIAGASAGLGTPAWFDLISKVIPVQRRGLFTGLSFGIGALMGLAGSAVIALVLDRWLFPANFAILFGLASIALLISWVGLLLNREPESLNLHAPMRLNAYLQRLPIILRENRNFSRYIGTMAIARAATMASGFFLVYGDERFQLSATDVGILTGILVGGQAILNPIWGMLGDRYGHKVVLACGAFALSLAALLAAFALNLIWLYAAFVLLSAFIAADTASFLTIIPEFCGEADRPTYIGLSNTLLAPVTALAPLFGGWLATVADFPPMFMLAGVLAAAGAALLFIWVREPRHTPEAAPEPAHG
ncbi:MAG: MFS transporter [Roseiflexaceae bacterium]